MIIVDPRSGIPFDVSFYTGFQKAMINVSAVWGVKVWKEEGVATLLGQIYLLLAQLRLGLFFNLGKRMKKERNKAPKNSALTKMSKDGKIADVHQDEVQNMKDAGWTAK